MKLSFLEWDETRRLREEYEQSVEKREQPRIPDIMVVVEESPAVAKSLPRVKEIPLRRIEATLNRVWGDELPVKIKGFDENWQADKPEIALIKTTAGDRVLKTEKPPTGQSGIVNEGISQAFYAELNLRSIRMGVDGLKRRQKE
jgi:hypothetical protein